VEIGLLYSHYPRDSCLATFNLADRTEYKAQIQIQRRPPTSYSRQDMDSANEEHRRVEPGVHDIYTMYKRESESVGQNLHR